MFNRSFEKPPKFLAKEKIEKKKKEITLDSIRESLPLKEKTKLYFKIIALYEKGLEDPDEFIRRGIARALEGLAPINPQLFISLYEKGLGDTDEYVREYAAQSLKGFAKVNPELASSLYKKGFEDSDSFVRAGTADALEALAPVNPELFLFLYEKGIKDSNLFVRRGAAESLRSLAKVNQKLFLSLYEKGLKDSDEIVCWSVSRSLANLVPVNPELASSLYKKGFKNPNPSVRRGIAEALEALAPINQKLFLSLYEKGLRDSDEFVCLRTSRSLRGLAKVNPELASYLYKRGFEDSNQFVRRGTADALEALAPVNPELFLSLYEKGIKDSDKFICLKTAQSLKGFAKVNPELASFLYKRGFEDSNQFVRRGTSDALGALALINQELFCSLYEKGIKDPSEFVCGGAAEALGSLAKVNQKLFLFLYEKGLKEANGSQSRMLVAQNLMILSKEIKISNQEATEIVNQETLKSFINTYGLSSRKKDKELFRTVIFLFKKEISPFLESKELPKTLKYHIKCGLIKTLTKEELLDYFKQAVIDFNLAIKKRSRESQKEERLILEFLSLLPISESSNYLVSQAKKLIPKIGNLNSIEMRTFKSLADINTRMANRFLLTVLVQPELDLRRKEYIFRKLVQNNVLEEGTLEYLGKSKAEKERFFKAIKEFRECFPQIIPTKKILEFYLKKGFSITEIKEKGNEFRKKDFTFPELISKLAKNKDLSAIYFALFPSPYRYDNILSFQKFQKILEEAEELEEINQMVKERLRSLWKKKGRTPEEIDQFLDFIVKGVPASEEIIRGREKEEKEKLKEISLETIDNLTRNFSNLDPIFALIGRLYGLLKKEKEKLKILQEKIKKAADYLDPSSKAVFEKENLSPLYQKLYLEYQKILKERGEKKILSQEELYQQDLNKFLNLLQKENIFTSEFSLNRQKKPKEIIDYVSKIILKRLKKYSKKQGEISEKFQIIIDDLKREIKISLENLKLKIETKPLRLTFKHIPKIDKKETKHLIEFMRIGDARESCIATDGTDSWTIPHYLKDFATLGFLILDQDKAIGHIIGHLGRDNYDNLVLLVNGIYIKGNYPSQAISQRVASYLEDFAQKTGLSEILIALSPHTDIVPPGYRKTSRIVQRFQGTMEDLYSDFGAPTGYLDLVECYEKVKK